MMYPWCLPQTAWWLWPLFLSHCDIPCLWLLSHSCAVTGRADVDQLVSRLALFPDSPRRSAVEQQYAIVLA